MSLRDDDELGSIRWAPDAFSAAKPSPSGFRFAAGVVSAVTVALLMLVVTLVLAALRSPAAPLTPIPVDMTPAADREANSRGEDENREAARPR